MDTPEPLPRPTSYDVARLAGVAQSTVSRCFGGDASISPATRARVEAAAQRLGYQPNALARSLITRRSDTVGVLVTRYTLRFSPDLIYAIGLSLAEAGKQLLLVPVGDDLPPAGALRRALAFPLDGLISCVTLAASDLLVLGRRRLPVVFFNRTPEDGTADSVGAAHGEAAAGVADALLEAGHRRFVCVAGPPGAPVSQARIDGFVRRLRERGLPPPPVLDSDYSYEGGRDAFLRHAGREAPPDAVMAANDQLAMGVMDACRFRLGLRVPEDVSVVGADDTAEGGRPTYGLTTLAQDLPAMAGDAVRLLLRRIAEPGAPAVNAVLPSVLVRRSSARLRQDPGTSTPS